MIDIPKGTDSKIEEDLIKCCHILIVHSWLDQSSTKRRLEEISLKNPGITIITFLRDQEKSMKNTVINETPLSNELMIPLINMS